jgi:hypothetical protein
LCIKPSANDTDTTDDDDDDTDENFDDDDADAAADGSNGDGDALHALHGASFSSPTAPHPLSRRTSSNQSGSAPKSNNSVMLCRASSGDVVVGVDGVGVDSVGKE